MKPQRTVFFVSDRTGITAEILGRTLLTQFPDVEFHKHTPAIRGHGREGANDAEGNQSDRTQGRPATDCHQHAHQ